MHKENLPLKVDPFRFADNAIDLHGTLPLKEMLRLAASLHERDGEVAVDLTFGVDEQGIRYIRGHLTTRLTLECQRCLGSFEYEIIDDFVSGLVHTEEEADELPERFDPLIVADNSLVLNDMVEEELIIRLPIVSMHNENECKVQLPFSSNTMPNAEQENENPFKVIELLRSNKRNVK